MLRRQSAPPIGNLAMRNLLAGVQSAGPRDEIVGTAAAVDYGQTLPMPPIALGALRIAGARVSFAEVNIQSLSTCGEARAADWHGRARTTGLDDYRLWRPRAAASADDARHASARGLIAAMVFSRR
jgi:hypothetical protein